MFLEGYHAVFTVSIRSEYAKLINTDSPSPDTVRPLRLFVGCEIERDRQARTLKLTQQGYIRKLVERFEGEFTPNDLPYGASKAKREAFEALRPGTEESAVDKAGYLVRRGSIGWPICMTRPECAFTYSVLCSLSMYPTAEAHAAAMHVVGYLVGTAEMGPIYGGRLKVPLGLSARCQRGSPRAAGYTRRRTAPSASRYDRMVGTPSFVRMQLSTGRARPSRQASRATKALLAARNVLSKARRPEKGPSYLLGDNSAMMNIIKRDGPTQRTPTTSSERRCWSSMLSYASLS